MLMIPIDTVPNQSLSVPINGDRWEIALKTTGHIMCADVTLNGEVLIQGMRLVAGSPIIPYEYLSPNGNFWFLTENELAPYWDRFNVDQQLAWIDAGEFDA